MACNAQTQTTLTQTTPTQTTKLLELELSELELSESELEFSAPSKLKVGALLNEKLHALLFSEPWE